MQKELYQRLLRELLRNSKQSDRDLARALNVSQPTISRIRKKLEKSGLIREYTIIPDFKKMGFELLGINFAKLRPEALVSGFSERAREYIARFPNTIFASTGEGMGMNAVSIAFYRSFAEYHKRVKLMRVEWKDVIENIQSFVVAIGEGEFKRFSLTHLKDVPL